ncbi:PREDICTED: RNA-binding motif protein, X-linked-like-3 isoform X6 [Acropora digitifera]|uniref:RNA-binding motif protein, X-linked-like-3 isoform X6 n=1 Tax=Acropora digitifera TaxID=70779 RepID=UPI00077AD495|nr:PREDICTED: RNA-binding motif protein, X-linked-like-3 isoform X6 [Acropora digitifera]
MQTSGLTKMQWLKIILLQSVFVLSPALVTERKETDVQSCQPGWTQPRCKSCQLRRRKIELQEPDKIVSSGPNGGVSYVNLVEEKFSYLNITVLGGDFVNNMGECSLACLETPLCFSLNLGAFPENNKLRCQLLPSDKYNNSHKFVHSDIFHHFSIATPCRNWPCQNNGKCLPVYEENDYKCICEGFKGKHCENDVNECTASSSMCHENAFCNNTLGSYNCSCKPGYYGDGKTCKDVDECTASSSMCHENAFCNNTLGSFNCTCKPRYYGDGKTCKAFVAVFTNLGASGRLGPTSIGSHYRGKDHDGQVTLASGIQNWTVPISGEYQVEAIGASGGYDTYANSRQYRGRGARMIGTFSLIKGEIIQILVGQEGGINTASNTSGGGGCSFVVRGAAIPLIIAGGGGGIDSATARHSQCDASTSTNGNTGYKSLAGGSGGSGAQAFNSGYLGGGGGGFYSSGRSSAHFGGTPGTHGGEGGKGFLQGGVGGRALHNGDGGFGGGAGAYGLSGGGAGGAGGYSGGGSGENEHDSCGGGGGSYNAGKYNQSYCCYNTAGHGKVIITFLQSLQ